jgi:hypothetical protein
MNEGNDKTVLVCDFRLRPHLAALLSRQLPQLAVLAYDEVVQGTPLHPAATVSMADRTEKPSLALDTGVRPRRAAGQAAPAAEPTA